MTNEEEKMLDECLNAEGGLSGRALDFIEQLDGDREMDLSPAQAEWLGDLATKACLRRR